LRRLWLKKCWLAFLALSVSCALAQKESHPLPQSQIDPQALKVLQISHQNYEDNLKDYKCIFLKRERFMGRLGDLEVMRMKLRTRPHSIYMKWLSGPNKRREVIYVEGKCEGKLLVHPGGLLGPLSRTLKLDPHSPLARMSSLEPITNAGMGKTLERMLLHIHEALEPISLTMDEAKDETSGKTYYLKKERLVKSKTFRPYKTVILHIDKELLLPFRILTYDWQDKLLGEYIYKNVKINVGLSDEDFDPKNKAYNFPANLGG